MNSPANTDTGKRPALSNATHPHPQATTRVGSASPALADRSGDRNGPPALRNYLSFGGGVNSVALYLLMTDLGFDFEAVFVDHGCDWPETYEYLDLFQSYLSNQGLNQITILRPKGKFPTILDKCEAYAIVPHMRSRWCTVQYKVQTCLDYYESPCFQHIGIDAGEEHRAKISLTAGVENRWLLIEHGIDREGCKQLIRDRGLPVPMKSGCFFCPMQRQGQWKQLRRTHPCLFEKARMLEKKNMEYAAQKGRKQYFLSHYKKPLDVIVDSGQFPLFKNDEYPPCQCELSEE